MRARVFKFRIHTESGQVYWGTENKYQIYFALFLLFSISHRKMCDYLELLHVGFCNLVQVLWIICCFMWKRTRFLLLILPLISLFFFLSNFQIKKSSFFSQGLRGTQSWNLVHTWTVGWCISSDGWQYGHIFIGTFLWPHFLHLFWNRRIWGKNAGNVAIKTWS